MPVFNYILRNALSVEVTVVEFRAEVFLLIVLEVRIYAQVYFAFLVQCRNTPSPDCMPRYSLLLSRNCVSIPGTWRDTRAISR